MGVLDRIDEYLEFACRVAELAGKAILPHFRERIEIENKAARGYDPVTVADRAGEETISNEIARAYPAHGIIGEEHGHKQGSDPLTWVIDPIDGTRAFVLGLLHWGTMIALNDGTRPILGVVHQPYVGETFAGSARGAELRRGGTVTRLRTRKCAKLEDAAVSATHPDMFHRRNGERAAWDLISTRARLTRYGGDCYAYCLLAAGFVDLVIESQLGAYDIQPVAAIVEAAGGVVTDWSGGSPYKGGRAVAAGDPALHRIALEILSRAGE
jgi:myo-inositol-1(or 4)-monophosphatase